MVSCPSRTRKNSSVSACRCQVNSPLRLHDPDVVVVDLSNLLWRPALSETRQHHVQIHRLGVPIVTCGRTRHRGAALRSDSGLAVMPLGLCFRAEGGAAPAVARMPGLGMARDRDVAAFGERAHGYDEG